MAEGQQEPQRSRGDNRRRVLRTPVAILAVIAVLAVSAVAVRAFASDGTKAKGCSGGIQLSIAAAPDMHTAVEGVAVRWAGTNPKVNGQCVRVEVTSAQPGQVAAAIAERAGARFPGATGPAAAGPTAAGPGAGSDKPTSADAPAPGQPESERADQPRSGDAQGPQAVAEGQGPRSERGRKAASPGSAEGGVPAVWIPDSTAWLVRTRAVAPDAFDATAPSIAMTPVVLGMSEEAAAGVLAGKPRLARADVAALVRKFGKDGVGYATTDPGRDSAGLAGAVVLRDAFGADKATAVVAAYRSVGTAATTADVLKEAKGKTMVPITEQAVLKHGAEAQGAVVSAVPIEQPPTLDYPLAVVNGKSADVTLAAQRFRTALTSGEYRNILSREGFRAPAGTTSADFQPGRGITAEAVAPNPLQDAAQIDDVLGYWNAAKAPARMLALIDTTSSMKQPVKGGGGASTRIDAVRKATNAGAGLLTDGSELGVWTYGATSKELVPIAPLSGPHRAKLTGAVSAAAAGANDTCGLYDALLSAYQAMRDAYQDGRPNTIVVFTDGANNAKTGLTADQLAAELAKVNDPTKPIRVLLLGIGPDANMADLTTVAGYVGGRAVPVPDPNQLTDAYLQVLLRP